MEKYVWYACYGSNLKQERFKKYIDQCKDKSFPKENRPFKIPYDMYFAKYTDTWRGAKAFIDISKPGFAYGRIYKITEEQYEQVKLREGRDYREKVDLGEVDGIPVYSFTDKQTNHDNHKPSDSYCKTIYDGLLETYGDTVPEEKLRKYLEEAKAR